MTLRNLQKASIEELVKRMSKQQSLTDKHWLRQITARPTALTTKSLAPTGNSGLEQRPPISFRC